MSVIGAAIILGLVVAALVKMKIARPVVVIVCVLFGLVLGATPIGDGLYSGGRVGRGVAVRRGDGRVMAALSSSRSDQPVQLRTPAVRVGAGLAASGWLLRRVWRLLVVTAATPAALAGLVLLVGRGRGVVGVAAADVVPGRARGRAAGRLPAGLAGPLAGLAAAAGAQLVAGLVGLPAPVGGGDGHRRPRRPLARHRLEPDRAVGHLHAVGGSGAGADAARPDRRGLRRGR